MELNASQIRADIKRLTGKDVPISGGDGSREFPIIVEENDPARSSNIVSSVVGFIYSMRGEAWAFVKSTIEEKNADGRVIEQYKIERDGDLENYYNFYFDISAMYEKKL